MGNIVNKKGIIEFEPMHKVKFHAVIKNHDCEKNVYKVTLRAESEKVLIPVTGIQC